MTSKQKAFVDEYLVDLNATQAAIRAGYSPRAASEQGSRLLSYASVRARVDEALAERSRRTGVTQDRVVRELARVAFVNAGDVIDFDRGAVREGANEDDVAAIASVRVKRIPTPEGEGVEREVKMSDKLKALELLGRHLGMFSDRVELAGALPVQIVDDVPNTDAGGFDTGQAD